jgi:hypothetical protein
MVLEFLVMSPLEKTNSISFILTNLQLRFDTLCAQLGKEVIYKRPNNKEYHPIFINFKFKNFTVKNFQKNKIDA